MNLARLLFFEFTEDPYDIIVATGETAAANTRADQLLPGTPRRMARAEVAGCNARPTLMDTLFHACTKSSLEWTCIRWLEEIEVAHRREAREAELAARQVELFT